MTASTLHHRSACSSFHGDTRRMASTCLRHPTTTGPFLFWLNVQCVKTRHQLLLSCFPSSGYGSRGPAGFSQCSICQGNRATVMTCLASSSRLAFCPDHRGGSSGASAKEPRGAAGSRRELVKDILNMLCFLVLCILDHLGPCQGIVRVAGKVGRYLSIVLIPH